jgi:hypothetical protein
MLGPVIPAPGGGDARRPLALAFRRHRPGDSFHEATDPQGRGQRPIIKKPVRRQRLKTDRKMMKLKIQFGPETCFDQPIRCLTRTEAQWSPGIRDLWHMLAMAGRPKPIELD